MTMNQKRTTPIEDRVAWREHHANMDAARARGACFDCATKIGFAATDARNGIERALHLHPRCMGGIPTERSNKNTTGGQQ